MGPRFTRFSCSVSGWNERVPAPQSLVWGITGTGGIPAKRTFWCYPRLASHVWGVRRLSIRHADATTPQRGGTC